MESLSATIAHISWHYFRSIKETIGKSVLFQVDSIISMIKAYKNKNLHPVFPLCFFTFFSWSFQSGVTCCRRLRTQQI